MSTFVVLGDARAQAVVAPRLGGRVLQFWCHGRPWLWTNPRLVRDHRQLLMDPAGGEHSRTIADWFNYGGDKCWPAPQGVEGREGWAGPPDSVLDAVAYAVVEGPSADGRSVTVRSRRDPTHGLRIERTITVDPQAAQLCTVNRVINDGERDSRWSAWTVTQVAADPGDYVEVEVDPHGREPLVLGEFAGRPSVDARAGYALVAATDCVGKVGFPAATGVVTFCRPDGSRLRQSFAIDPDREYPDGGCRAEV